MTISIRHSHSDSAAFIAEQLNAQTDTPTTVNNTSCIVNYGLFNSHNPELGQRQNIPVINQNWAGNKLECLRKVSQAGVVIPETAAERPFCDSTWIIKPLNSRRGQGIEVYTPGRHVNENEYLQKRVEHRCYELRVQCAAWLPLDKWKVIKRTNRNGNNELAWNRDSTLEINSHISLEESNTGVFRRAKEMAQKAMIALGYQFGAVDFIVARPPGHSGPLPVYFLEFNTEPCCVDTTPTKEWYLAAFRKLAEMPREAVYALPGMTQPRARQQQAPIFQPVEPAAPQVATRQRTGGIRNQLENVLSQLQNVQNARINELLSSINSAADTLQRVIELL